MVGQPSSKEIREFLEKKKLEEKAKRVDVPLLESFGVDPTAHDVDHLATLTKACVAAVKDGRVTPTTPLNFRIHAEYKEIMHSQKMLIANLSYAKLLGMLMEAVACGDIRIARGRHDPKHRRLYGDTRLLMLDREGRIINTTVRDDRPHGTRF